MPPRHPTSIATLRLTAPIKMLDSPRPMLFDDRLATVLRSNTGGETAARTQYRQLLDLLGSKQAAGPDELRLARYHQIAEQAGQMSAEELGRILERPGMVSRNHTLLTFLAYHRLAALNDRIPAEERSRILREPGLRLRNRRLVAFLAEGDAKPAASAVATARLEEEEWLALIPRVPMIARGFLRHRRDLPASAKDLLGKLGVGDLVLPEPAGTKPAAAAIEAAPPLPHQQDDGDGDGNETKDRDGIRALLRRIEAFREGRRDAAPAPRLPLGDAPDDDAAKQLESFEFTSDAEGRISWVSSRIAPYCEGMLLGPAAPGVIAVLEDKAVKAMQLRQPMLGAKLVIDAAPVIAGEWRVDAEPCFAPPGGQFSGYRGRIRRPVMAGAAAGPAIIADSPADRMRQVLHELRTPVNAVQGFAEIIQQQLFGHAPNEYRALAAAVAVDAAKLLASFDEIDRLARLESAALDLDNGESDLREVIMQTIQRLDGALRPRNAGFEVSVSGSPFTAGLAPEELRIMVWRVLATLAGSLAPSERITLDLTSDGKTASLLFALPQSIAAMDDKFTSKLREKRPALSAGMFGTGFSFRLARAETLAAGGTFEMSEEQLEVKLPLLTANRPAHSSEGHDENAA